MTARPEEMEAQRLSDMLDDLEIGREPDLDERTDAELASLVETSSLLRRTWNSVAPSAAYISRSRAFILQSLSAEAEEPAATPPARVLPFYRRWAMLSPVASAAAAAAVTFAITIWATGGATATVAGPALSSVPSEQPASVASAAPAFVEPPFVEPARPPLVLVLRAVSRRLPAHGASERR